MTIILPGIGGGLIAKASAPAPALTVPAGAIAAYSIRKIAGMSVTSCMDVVDSTAATTTIGFVGNLCDFATIASLPQPVVISKWYDQTGNGNHAVQTTAVNRPTMNPGVAPAIIFDSVGNNAASNPAKYLTMPAGVAISEASFSVFFALRPKYALNKNGYFTFNTASAFINMYSLKDLATALAGQVNGLGDMSYATNNVPDLRGAVMGMTGNGTTGTWFVDEASGTFTCISRAVTGGYIGYLTGQSFFAMAADMYAFVVYPSVLSGVDQTAIQANLRSTFSIPTPSIYTKQVYLDGDSITTGIGATLNRGWAKAFQAALSTYRAFNFGFPGQTMAQLNTAASARIASRFNAGMTKNIVVIWAGTNDIRASVSAATTFAQLQAYTSTVKAAGFKVVWVTMLPRTDLTAPMQTEWTNYNNSIKGATLGLSNTADVIADVQSDPVIGPFAAASDTTLYCNVPGDNSVGVHPTDLGNTYVLPYIVNAVNSL